MISEYMVLGRVAQIFIKRSCITIVCVKRMTQKKFHAKDPQILGTIVQILLNRIR